MARASVLCLNVRVVGNCDNGETFSICCSLVRRRIGFHGAGGVQQILSPFSFPEPFVEGHRGMREEACRWRDRLGCPGRGPDGKCRRDAAVPHFCYWRDYYYSCGPIILSIILNSQLDLTKHYSSPGAGPINSLLCGLTLFWHSFFPASNMSVCKCTISSTSDEQNNRDWNQPTGYAGEKRGWYEVADFNIIISWLWSFSCFCLQEVINVKHC